MKPLAKLYRAVVSRYYTYQANKKNFNQNDLEVVVRNIFLNCDIPYNTFLCFESADKVAAETSGVNLDNPNSKSRFLEQEGNKIASCYTTIDDNGKVMIVVSLELIHRELMTRDDRPSSIGLFDILNMLIMHEIWHAHQFRYIYDTHGNQEVINVCRREQGYPYGEGPLESGANAYSHSNGFDKQKLKEAFG